MGSLKDSAFMPAPEDDQQDELPVFYGPESGPCAVCGKAGAKPCSRCGVDFYCGLEHRAKDWPRHKQGCGVLAVRRDPKMGRYLEATKDIPAGTIIMREVPLVACPAYASADMSEPHCVGCCKVLRGRKARCARCGWHVCGSACSRSALHAAECAAFQRAGYKYQGHSSRRDCFALSVLRVCLAARQPVVGPLLMDLQSERPKGDEVAAKALAVAKRKTCLDKIEDTVKDMKEMSPAERMVSLGQLLGNLFLGDDGDGDVGNDCWWSEADWAANWLTKTVGMSWLDADDLRRWAGVLNINSHAFSSAAGGATVTWLSAGMSLPEHGCLPNTVLSDWTVQLDANGEPEVDLAAGPLEHVLVTARPVARGEHITLSYLNCAPLQRRAVRRRQLARTWGFACRCALCADPDDGGLRLDAWHCAVCKGRGEQRLVQLDVDGVLWRCDGCRRSGQLNGRVDPGQHDDEGRVQAAKLATRLGALRRRLAMQGPDEVPLLEWESFLRDAVWPRGPLHATSALVLDAKREMVNYSTATGPDPDGESRRLAALCRELLVAFDTLSPGHLDLRKMALIPLVRHLQVRFVFLCSTAPHRKQDIKDLKQEIADLIPDLKKTAFCPHDSKFAESIMKQLHKCSREAAGRHAPAGSGEDCAIM